MIATFAMVRKFIVFLLSFRYCVHTFKESPTNSLRTVTANQSKYTKRNPRPAVTDPQNSLCLCASVVKIITTETQRAQRKADVPDAERS